MPDFYQNLKLQFERVRQAQIMLDGCMSNLTNLMEQAAHMFTEVADVPPVVAEEEPAIPSDWRPVESDGGMTAWRPLPPEVEAMIPGKPVIVSYEGNVCQPSIGTVKYE